MILDSIELSGWMPFAGSFRLNLPSGPIAVVGSHAGDARRSNRAGKTSLLEAITWCLFGWHRKRIEDAIINRSVQECVVTVTIGSMRVTRSRKRGSSTKLTVRHFDVIAGDDIELTGEAAQNHITTDIGFGLEDYLATQCFRQGDVESIVSQTAGDRLSIVSEWLQQTRWFDAKKLQAAKTTAAELRLVEKSVAAEAAGAYVVSDENRAQLQARHAELKQQTEALDVQCEEASNRLVDSSTAKSQLNTHRELQEVRLRAQDLRARLAGRGEVDARTAQAAERETVARTEMEASKDGLAELDAIREKGFDGVCPITCEQCPAAQHVTEVVQTASALFEERSGEYNEKWSRYHTLATEHAAAKRESLSLTVVASQYQSVCERGKQLARSVTMTEDEAKAAPSGQQLQLELEELGSRMKTLIHESSQISSALLNAQRAQERHTALRGEVEAARRTAVASRLALKAISSVPARIAEQQLGELEQEANMLLEGTGVSLRFSWARELADKAPQCEECGFIYPSKRGDACPTCHAPRGKKRAQELELLCDDGSGAEEDVRFNSGGTRAIVGASIRLAASAMLRRLRSSHAAWAIVDEPFGSLDAENREQLARTFMGMLASVGLEQALVVSHDAALLAALPNRIVIDKDGSSSTVRVE